MAWLAAELCGIRAETPDPEGGKIYRNESGDFTGLLAYVSCAS